MPALTDLKATLGEETKDLRLNLDAVLKGQALDPAQAATVALASALFVRDIDLANAIHAEAGDLLSPDAVADARAPPPSWP